MSIATSRVSTITVALDCVIRVGVLVVVWSMIREWWGEFPESNADGPPGGLLVVPLVALLGWNVAMIGSSIRRWLDGALANTSFLALVGGLSALRVAWLLPVADEVVTDRHDLLIALTIGSAACALAALAVAIVLNGGIYHPPVRRLDDER